MEDGVDVRMQVCDLRYGTCAMIDGRPCVVGRVKETRPGRLMYGRRVEGVDVFDDAHRSVVTRTHFFIDLPAFRDVVARVTSVRPDGTVELDGCGRATARPPKEGVDGKARSALAQGLEVRATVRTWMDEARVLRFAIRERVPESAVEAPDEIGVAQF